MPKAPITKRLYIANFLGIKRTCEKHTKPGKKRLESAKPVVFGDGLSTVTYCHDPAIGTNEITLSFITTKDDPFVREAEAALLKHKNDPGAAEPTLLLSHKDDGSVLGTKTAVRAVIQEVNWPEGDTNAHGESMVEIRVQPEDMI